MNGLVLLIDDDESLLEVTGHNLNSGGFQVITATSGADGLKKFKADLPDIVITDVQLGDITGLDLLKEMKQTSPETPVIVFTAFGSIDMAVEAMRCGAFHFITKPFDRDTLRLSCRKALEFKTLKTRNVELVDEIDRLTGAKGIETASSAMRELVDTALRVAHSEASVLITGESGTGKEVLARLIHQSSPRKTGPLVSVNCAAIPETLIESELFGHVKGAFTGAVKDRKGKFKAAENGTLFLDEIGDMKIEMQAKLLRAVQEMEVEPVGSETRVKTNIRLITATNKNLKESVGNGEFREDLFYRISVIPLHIPPLRERQEDIPLLADHFLKRFMAPAGMKFSKDAMGEMKKYSWPGNIRELQNTVERVVILAGGPMIEKEDLNIQNTVYEAGWNIPEIPEEGISLENVEKGLIQKALAMCRGNRSKASRLLKIPRHVLIYRLEKYDL